MDKIERLNKIKDNSLKYGIVTLREVGYIKYGPRDRQMHYLEGSGGHMKELVLKPEVLRHLPLHGLSPRSVKGTDWWDTTRKGVYKSQDYRCIACGVHKTEAKYHNWIEAHESYTIDYGRCSMEIEGIIGLCHSCHNFIHCGRLKCLLSKGEISNSKFRDIMLHGFKVLKDAGLQPNATQVTSYIDYLNKYKIKVPRKLAINAQRIINEELLNNKTDFQKDWGKWYMVLEGFKYKSKFSSMAVWDEYFNG